MDALAVLGDAEFFGWHRAGLRSIDLSIAPKSIAEMLPDQASVSATVLIGVQSCAPMS